MLIYIYNGVLHLNYVSEIWKIAKIISVLKPEKPVDFPNSYKLISLSSLISKLFKKLFLSRVTLVIEKKNSFPGFRKKLSTVDQVHRVVAESEETLENKEFCPAIFLDVSQAFNSVRQDSLIHKLE